MTSPNPSLLPRDAQDRVIARCFEYPVLAPFFERQIAKEIRADVKAESEEVKIRTTPRRDVPKVYKTKNLMRFTKLVKIKPGITAKEVAELSGMGCSRARELAKSLVEAGVLTAHPREGNKPYRYFLAEEGA
jgi:hypothetical protein